MKIWVLMKVTSRMLKDMGLDESDLKDVERYVKKITCNDEVEASSVDDTGESSEECSGMDEMGYGSDSEYDGPNIDDEKDGEHAPSEEESEYHGAEEEADFSALEEEREEEDCITQNNESD